METRRGFLTALVVAIPARCSAEPADWMEVDASWYCPCDVCCGVWSRDGLRLLEPALGITATGKPPVEGRTVAVDPDVIPLGSLVEIEGIGVRRAEDTGGAIRGKSVDIYVVDHAAARKFGRRTVRMRLIRRGR